MAPYESVLLKGRMLFLVRETNNERPLVVNGRTIKRFIYNIMQNGGRIVNKMKITTNNKLCVQISHEYKIETIRNI